MIREAVPLGDAEVPAVYLVPFHRAERPLASGLLQLLHTEQDRMAAFQQVDWDQALTWLRGRWFAQQDDRLHLAPHESPPGQ